MLTSILYYNCRNIKYPLMGNFVFLPNSLGNSIKKVFTIIGSRHGSNYVNRSKHIDLSVESTYLKLTLPAVMDEILEEQLVYHKHYQELKERYRNLLNHTLNLEDLYLSVPLFLIRSYREFEKPALQTDENLKRAAILAWSLKLAEASMIVDDDVIDKSKVRYLRPTWYKKPDVGVEGAICDSSFLLSGGLFLLLNHFRKHLQFSNILKEYYVNYSTCMLALCIDSKKYKVQELKLDFAKAYPITVINVICAMYLSNIVDPVIHATAKEFLKDLAKYVQIEDDVKCVFNTHSEKDCTDVAQGKSSWLAIQAYERGSREQRFVLENHYGKSDNESQIRIYQLYKDLRLDDHFEKFREDFYESMIEKIQTFPQQLPKQLFFDLLDYGLLSRIQS
uniref:Terpene synthase n=1 Tax=Phyllotreta armoraciae TaxID=1553667 RepID=A0A140AZ76_9CUCU|nr:terpene synthase [Phyllotreta armoraciae]